MGTSPLHIWSIQQQMAYLYAGSQRAKISMQALLKAEIAELECGPR